MTEKDYKKAKRNVYILTGLMAAVLLLVLGVFVRFTFKKDNPELSVQTLVHKLEQAQTLYLKLEDTQYTLPANENVTRLFETLQPTKARPQEELWITLHFGELYEFYIYESGIVEGFDGYAATATKTTAWYETDSTIYEQLKRCILTDGTTYAENLGFFR